MTNYWPTTGWRGSTPEAQGMDSARLAQIEAYVRQNAPYIQSVLVVRHGYRVYERYFGGVERDLVWGSDGSWGTSAPYPAAENGDQVHNVKSVTKCFMSALIGLAVKEGFIDSIDRTIDTYFPEYYANIDDPRKRNITIRHLLMMRSGLEWVENGPVTIEWIQSRNQVEFGIKKLPLAADPGQRWNYNTVDTHLLSAILTKVTGMSALDFADRYLFGPLGITNRRWTPDPQGYNIGGSELFLTAPDMAKFGCLYLHNGQWDGKPLIPADWVALTTAAQPDVTADVISDSMPNLANIVIPPGTKLYRDGYGYKWWHTTFGGYPCHYAAGYGGQYIFILPGLDMIVVEQASTDIRPEEFTLERRQSSYIIVDNLILPAVIDEVPSP